MTTLETSKQQLTDLQALLDEKKFESVESRLLEMPIDDAARLVARLSEEAQLALLANLRAEDAADLIRALPFAQASELVEELPATNAADIIEEMESNEQADFVGQLDDDQASAIFAEMEPQEADQLRTLVSYDDDVAGGLMNARVLSFKENLTVAHVVEEMRKNFDVYRDYEVQYAYVVQQNERLVGVLRLRDLLLADPDRAIADLMIRDPHSVVDTTPLDELRDFFVEHHFLGVPVVNRDGVLVGVCDRTSVEEALADRTTDDYLKAQGIIQEELRTMPTLTRSRRRLAWLSANIFLNLIAASVIAFYQDTLAQVIALAVFLPIISDMSGCSGNQAVAVSMRELSLGLINAMEVVRVWLKEIAVGILNGLALGLLIGSIAWLWKGNVWLGAVVGLALMINTMIAVSIGGTLPLFMRRLGVDPALASGPILTTVTDLCGFFIILSMAAAMMPLITG